MLRRISVAAEIRSQRFTFPSTLEGIDLTGELVEGGSLARVQLAQVGTVVASDPTTLSGRTIGSPSAPRDPYDHRELGGSGCRSAFVLRGAGQYLRAMTLCSEGRTDRSHPGKLLEPVRIPCVHPAVRPKPRKLWPSLQLTGAEMGCPRLSVASQRQAPRQDRSRLRRFRRATESP